MRVTLEQAGSDASRVVALVPSKTRLVSNATISHDQLTISRAIK